jgi:hypothetical protein
VSILNLIYRHDVALEVFEPERQAGGFVGRSALAMHTVRDEREIRDAHSVLGHRISQSTLERRLANQLAFTLFSIDERPVASSWLASGGRYIDELNWWLPIDPGDLWLRDVFVPPELRGRRLFSDLVIAVAAPEHGNTRRIWSDVDWINTQSMRAHEKAGFRIVARVRAFDIAGRIRLRSALPPWPLPVTEIDPASRWIWLRGRRLHRHQELLA